MKIKPVHFRFKSNLKVNPAYLHLGKRLVSITLETSNKELVFEDRGGIPTSILNYIIRISSDDGKIDGVFENRTNVLSTAEELAAGANKTRIIYQHSFELPAGKYRIGTFARWGGGVYESGLTERSVQIAVR